jgi:hypothetical protein
MPPPEKRRLTQLAIESPFRECHLADKMWTDPLDSFGDSRRIFDRRFIGEEGLQPFDRFFQSFFCKAAAERPK